MKVRPGIYFADDPRQGKSASSRGGLRHSIKASSIDGRRVALSRRPPAWHRKVWSVAEGRRFDYEKRRRGAGADHIRCASLQQPYYSFRLAHIDGLAAVAREVVEAKRTNRIASWNNRSQRPVPLKMGARAKIVLERIPYRTKRIVPAPAGDERRGIARANAGMLRSMAASR